MPAKPVVNGQRACEWCAQEYEAVEPNQRFCGPPCRYAHFKHRMLTTLHRCPRCGRDCDPERPVP